MEGEIKLYGSGRPTRSTRAAWALEEVGATYDYVLAPPGSPELLAVNPMGKLPALVAGDLVLTESAAICTWVADRFPESGLAPEPRTDDRARYDRWCYFACTELEQPPWTKAKHRFVLPAEVRRDGLDEAIAWEMARACMALELELDGRPFLVGDRFTCADLLCTHTLFWAMSARMEVPDALKAYARQHLSRPALARAVAREEAANRG